MQRELLEMLRVQADQRHQPKTQLGIFLGEAARLVSLSSKTLHIQRFQYGTN